MAPKKNLVALVTGATAGIGKAFAKKFAKDGYDLIITGRRQQIIESVAEKISKKYGVKVEVIIAELADDNDLNKLIQKIQDTLNLDILVNNAGFATVGNFHEGDIRSKEDMVKVHVLATMKLTYAAIPNMLTRGKGSIINVSSLSAFAPSSKGGTYSGTKAFLNVFTESLQLELLGTGINVQVLCPGFTRTDFHERMGFDNTTMWKNRGVFRWASAEEVVIISLRDLKIGRTVSIPGFWNNVIRIATRFLPRSILYKMV